MIKKNEFFNTQKQQIKVYNEMLEALAKIKAFSAQYDGKIINKRFVDALKAELPPCIDVILEKEHYTAGDVITLTILDQNRLAPEGGYVDESVFKIHNYPSEYIDADTRRLNYAVFCKALKLKTDSAIYNRDDLQNALDNYDKFYEAYLTLKRHADEYRKTLPYVLRCSGVLCWPVYGD